MALLRRSVACTRPITTGFGGKTRSNGPCLATASVIPPAGPIHPSSRQRRDKHSQGYQSMGSFHSDHLGMLMSLSEDDYQLPSLPFDDDSAVEDDPSSDFMLDRTHWTFLNHGAFGGALTVGYRRAEQWRRHLERQPLRYFDRDLLPHLALATRRLAAFASCDNKQGLTLVQNATAGLNSVLKGFRRIHGPEARVILWDTSYGSLKKLAHHVFGANKVAEIPLQAQYLPRLATTKNPDQVFLEALDDTLRRERQGDAPCLLVLDHTTSNTAMNMPIEAMAKHVQQSNNNIQILVDGAHGLLAQQVHLDNYTASGIDYYVANGHKWLSCPRGVGMLYCPHDHLRDTVLSEPAIISHGVDESDLLSRFVWDGCRDYAAALALPTVLDYWQDANPELVRETMKTKLLQGIQLLASDWHHVSSESDWLPTGVTLVPPSLLSPMALVRLPRNLCGSSTGNRKTSDDAKRIQDFLFDSYIEVPIKCINGELFVRVSCHIYNELEEFDRLAKVMVTYPG